MAVDILRYRLPRTVDTDYRLSLVDIALAPFGRKLLCLPNGRPYQVPKPKIFFDRPVKFVCKYLLCYFITFYLATKLLFRLYVF